MPLFDGDDLLAFIEQATWVTLNDYEAELMQERTEKSLSELAKYVKAIDRHARRARILHLHRRRA